MDGGLRPRRPTADDRRPATDHGQLDNGLQTNTFISPIVARLAQEHQLDLSQISGSGQGGRVSKKDVLRYIESRSQVAPSAAVSPTAPAAPAVAAVPFASTSRAAHGRASAG